MPQALQAPSQTKLSTALGTEFDLASLAATILKPAQINEITDLLPIAACKALLVVSTDEPNCHPLDAVELTGALMKSWRRGEFNDPDTFATGAAATFALFPLNIGRKVISPVEGLPSTLKFPPTIAELRSALDAAMARRRAIHYRARRSLEEHERRSAEARRQADIAAIPSARKAEMAEFARNAMRGRPMSDSKEEAA